MNARTAIPWTALICALMCLHTKPAHASEPRDATRDWPEWRGPNQDSKTTAAGVLGAEAWSLEVAWKRHLGSGYSSVSAVGGRLVTMYADGGDDVLVALDAGTGTVLWRYRLAPTYQGHTGSQDGPVGTPTVAGGTVYAVAPRGQLVAVRLEDGDELWTRHLRDDFGAPEPTYGFSTSPMVVEDVLVVQTGAPDGGAVTGLDRHTGEVLWSAGDDRVIHQSPIVATLGGTRQVVAATERLIYGIVPESGEVLWSFEHQDDETEGDWEFWQPVLVGEKRVLLSYYMQDAVLFEVTRHDETGWSAREVWRSDAFRGTYAVPIYHDGHLYGFRGRFLSCIDAGTGEVLWKSRPPGAIGHILVDDHSIALDARGHVVVGRVSPRGYEQKVRVKVLESGAYTPPSFAHGRIYVRNLEELASLAVRTGAATMNAAKTGAAKTDFPPGRFGDFLKKVRAAGDRRAMIDRFLAEEDENPILEGDWAHLVYRGEAADVAVVSSSWFGTSTGERMRRVEGTDFFYRSFLLHPAGLWEYQLQIDFGDPVADPRNPFRFETPQGETSAVVTAGWEEPRHIRTPEAGAPRGRLESFSFASEIAGDERKVQVYLPPGYEESGRRYPVLVVTDGEDALRFGQMKNTLDHLAGTLIEPLIAVFVEFHREENGFKETSTFTEVLAREIVPRIDERYRTRCGPASRGIMGRGAGAGAALLATFEYPETFGRVATQSYFAWTENEDRIVELAENCRERGLRLHLDGYRSSYRLLALGRSSERDHRRLSAALEQHGCRFTTEKNPGAPGWGSWRARSDEMLAALFRLES